MRAQGSAHQNFQGRHSAPVQHSAQLSRSSISKPLQDLVNRCNKLNSSLALSQQVEPVLSSNVRSPSFIRRDLPLSVPLSLKIFIRPCEPCTLCWISCLIWLLCVPDIWPTLPSEFSQGCRTETLSVGQSLLTVGRSKLIGSDWRYLVQCRAAQISC